MRDEKRIYPFINEIATLWLTSFPDWRFGQMMNVFENWVRTNFGYKDLFYKTIYLQYNIIIMKTQQM